VNVDFIKPYAKAIVAFCSAGVLIGKAVADGTVDGSEFELIAAAVTALLVYVVPNAEG
jgi:hypothetical protein